MALLPSYLVLQSGGKYLSVTEKIPASLPSGFLKFDEEDIFSPRVKFAVEPSETTGLVHIRSCYNNKYLVTKQIDKSFWIVACAKKPEEDQSKDSCTLFEPQYSFLAKKEEKEEEEDSSTTTKHVLRLRHVQSRISATHSSDGTDDDDTRQGVLVASSSSAGSVFNAIDWNTLVILPTEVAFRSEDVDGGYLISVVLDRWYPYQKFETGWDIGDPLVAKDLYPTANGYYRIFDLHFGKFWRRSPNWIWADAENNNYSNDTLFSFFKINDKVMALRNLGNNNFCGALTTEGKTDCLNAQYPNLSRQTRLIVEERVIERQISNIAYRLSDSRIYQEHIQEVSHAFATNNSPNNESTIALTYSISDSRTTTWTNSVSINFGVKVEFETAIIPLISSGKVELTTELGYTHQWGVTETQERKRESTYNVVVPPLTTIKVTLMCTTAACDVPFSYTQRDLRTSGQWVSANKNDGIFTGINSYNFYFQSSKVRKDSEGRVYM